MAQRSFFFNSENHDRVYDAADFARVFSRYFTNGVFNNGLQVKSNNNMTISVSIGSGNINGYLYDNDEDLILDIEPSDSSQSRIDSIILRLDLINKQITAQVLKGAFSTAPTKPTLTRSSSIYDLRLADISISAGSNRITTENIYDARFGNECGNVTATVQQIDTSGVFAQYEAEFDKLITQMRNLLDEDTAGRLQNEINAVTKRLDTLENNQILYGTCTEEEFQAAMAELS